MEAQKVPARTLGNGIPKRDNTSLKIKQLPRESRRTLSPGSALLSPCQAPPVPPQGLAPRAHLHSGSLVLFPLHLFPFGLVFLAFPPAGCAMVQKFRSSEIGHSEHEPCLASLWLPGLSQACPMFSPHSPGPNLELSLALPLSDDILSVPQMVQIQSLVEIRWFLVQRGTAGHGLNVPGVAPRNLKFLSGQKQQGRTEDHTALPDPGSPSNLFRTT